MTTPQPQTTHQPTATPTTSPAQRVLLTVEQAAAAIGIGRTTTYTLIKNGELTSVKVGRLRRIPLDELQAYMDRLITQQHPTAATEGN
jgi:excisionase family DNA binding protein